jgi:glycerol-3-phosphate dehydrogenase (NAD(P)+)
MKSTIGILGAGSWGATLSWLLHANGYPVTLWEISESQARQLDKTRRLTVLPELKIPREVIITSDISDIGDTCRIIVCAVPSQYVRTAFQALARARCRVKDGYVITVTKGLENETFLRMSQVITDCVPRFKGRVAALSGPSHAEEVSKGIPTAVVAASSSRELAEHTQKIFMNKTFRVYTNDDIVGVELGAALKNVLAIGCGICDGLGLGDNTKAALITRGLAEMTRFGMRMGAKEATFTGLSGLGDLVVTCTSRHSRNRLFGEKIGQGKHMAGALKEMVMIAEGVPTARAVYGLAQKLKEDLPISEQVYAVLYKDKDPRQAITELMTRAPKPE